jgi:hypothetical protein
VRATASHPRNITPGTLPPSWANLSSLSPTSLLLDNNNLTGSIPAAWGDRSSTPWAGLGVWGAVQVINNSRMCGLLPAWYTTRFANASSLANVASLAQGEAAPAVLATLHT